MRIRLLSDLHLEVHPFVPPPMNADVVVLAGDIHNGARAIEWAKRTFDVPVLFVPGNHEYYDGEFRSVDTALAAAAAGSHVELLNCGERILAGVRFLGCSLWTDYSLVGEAARPRAIEQSRKLNPDHMAIGMGTGKFSPEDAIALCRSHRAWLEGRLAEPFPGTTVVITHFAPHPGSIAPAYAGHPANPGFVVDLESMMGRAPLWLHGHTHTAFDYNVAGTRIVCNPRGNPGEQTGFREGLVLEC
ncbi:MAG: serine/threonine protein phosphatase [Betaproteobacteria bacterium]|nr:serine/threonine protein phosphatase [Betaproteobacteria bacterium]